MKLLRPARTLAEMGDTLLKQPLQSKDEFDAFYSDKYLAARGIDRTSHLQTAIGRCFHQAPFHSFVMGHPGVGKSTEISRLLLTIGDRFRLIRISAAKELNPSSFGVHDLLWLMIIRVLSETQSPTIMGFSDRLPSGLLEDVRQELSQHWVEILGVKRGEVEGGLDLKLLFAKITASLKLSRQRTEKTVEYIFAGLSDLLEVVNRVFDECNNVLRDEKGQEWILAVEDFEKFGVDADSLRQLFIDNALLFDQLECHLLFVIPVALAHTEDAERMPFGRTNQYMIPDIPVYTQRDHEPDEKGISSLLDVINRRLEPALLDESLARSLSIASGGNIRDLFDLLRYAGTAAEARGTTRIEREDAVSACQSLRSSYRSRLGESAYGGPTPILIEDKLKKLEAIYRGDPIAQIPDKTLYILLRQRMVLQFNGKVWYGVHPLVVDILKEQGRPAVKPDDKGGTDLIG